MGSSGRDIPIETQMLLLEAKEEPDGPASYILFLPVLDGEFRSSLQGNPSNELELCIESGKISLHSASNVSFLFSYSITLCNLIRTMVQAPAYPASVIILR